MSDKKDDVIIIEGVVREALPGARFKVEIFNKKIIEGHISGKMRMHYIKLLVGDKVTIELSPYDLTKGRIIKRHRKDT